MTLDPAYASRYPRQGQVAVLCEGDVAGYEVDLLEKWLAAGPGNVFVDVWPCGTKSALYGVSDAIGRGRPIVVIEDRDCRTQDQAAKDCDSKKKDRMERGVGILDWRTWQRNEIENYLIEPAVLIPVLAQAFGISESDTEERLKQVVSASATDQAALWALAVFWDELPDRARFAVGLPRRTARPVWRAQQTSFVPPDTAIVRDALHDRLAQAAKGITRRTSKLDVDGAIVRFDKKCAEWADTGLESDTWRIDWAGKELLTTLFRWLSGEFGWQDPDTGQLDPINWEQLIAERTDAEMDRTISRAIQPRLVSAFLQYLADNDGAPAVDEWHRVRGAIKKSLSNS